MGRPWNAAESPQRQTCKLSLNLEREHNARWAALGVVHATSGITANVLTLLLPRSIPACNQLNPYLQGAQGKDVEQWQIAQCIVRAAAALFFVMYVRANSSILVFALTVTCRTNPVRVPGVIVRLCSLGWPTGLHGQVNPLASSETTVLKTRFGPGDAGDPLSRSIAFDRTSTERSCHVGKGSTDTRIQV